jgi:hypothetical protein
MSAFSYPGRVTDCAARKHGSGVHQRKSTVAQGMQDAGVRRLKFKACCLGIEPQRFYNLKGPACKIGRQQIFKTVCA